MCALCGVLGGDDHWSDATARPGVFTLNTSPQDRRRGRAVRVAKANQILERFGMQLADWQGSSYMLSTVTGKTEMVGNLAHLWPAAERLAGRALDPLSPEFLGRLGDKRG
jgi:hypothetical protein